MHLLKNDQSLERLYIYSVTYIVKARLIKSSCKAKVCRHARREKEFARLKEVVYCLFVREVHARSFLLHPHFLRQPRRLLDAPKAKKQTKMHSFVDHFKE